MARVTSGGMIDPPSTVTTPTPLMTGFMPSPAYNDDGDDAVRPVPVAAAAAAGTTAAVPRRRRRVSFIIYHYRMRLPLVFLCVNALIAQAPYDLLLKGGHVIDPKNKISAQRDIAIRDGLIAAVASDIPAAQARKVVTVAGLYITPGFIDLHAHVFAGSDAVGLAGVLSTIFRDDVAL